MISTTDTPVPAGRFLTVLIALLTVPAALPAQNGAERRAEATITVSEYMRRIGIIAHDSMGGRDTPSRGLDLTAEYVASEFRRLRLQPGGDNGGYIQRYPIRRVEMVPAESRVSFTGEGQISMDFTRDAVMFIRGERASGAMLLAGGPLDFTTIDRAAINGKVLVWVTTLGGPTFQTANRLRRMGPAAIVLIVPPSQDSIITAWLARQIEPAVQAGEGGGTPLIAVRESAIVAQFPNAADAIAGMRAATTPTLQDLPDWIGMVDIRTRALSEASGPNVVGILEGSDPELKHEYVVFSAHIDHVGHGDHGGCRGPVGEDRICNGADDDASGTAGVLELAEAYVGSGARPKRSMIFLLVSGEEKGLWGSDWFGTHSPVPLDRIVANLNMDMIGRNWADSIVVIGKQHSDLGETLAKVHARHPELNMVPMDDRWPEQSFYTRSDHFNFARRGVPVLFFFNGVHDDYHQDSDEIDKINGEKAVRIVKMVYWLGTEVANNPERPKWNPESERQFVTARPRTTTP